ncbi:hypothetical protein T484DRAFT_1770262 [Baffinella frigidus]|nr:hypothetical protein T484DRAFT_1770262 [Cryptophyta sp. CCMP2293]
MGDKLQKKLVDRLRASAKINGKICADCTDKCNVSGVQGCGPWESDWAFQHKCKGISMSLWTAEEVASIEEGGNVRHTPEAGDTGKIRKFITLKYRDKKWDLSHR